MKHFTCPSCASRVWFDNLECGHCGIALGYEPSSDAFVVMIDACGHRTDEQCNWTAAPDAPWCASCALDLETGAVAGRAPFEAAKRRTLRQLHLLGVDPARRSPALRFDLRFGTEDEPVVTGHADGVITLNTAEADPAERERQRLRLGEPYRTPLGHVRHELGHWWWATSIDHEIDRDAFRTVFGDERADYADALADHYARPDDGAWRSTHISHYAASHPWEDFAESFAHLLHIDDTFETATHVGLTDEPVVDDFGERYRRWVPVTLALNELNRAMGMPDPYPFVVASPAVDKIRFVADSLGPRTR